MAYWIRHHDYVDHDSNHRRQIHYHDNDDVDPYNQNRNNHHILSTNYSHSRRGSSNDKSIIQPLKGEGMTAVDKGLSRHDSERERSLRNHQHHHKKDHKIDSSEHTCSTSTSSMSSSGRSNSRSISTSSIRSSGSMRSNFEQKKQTIISNHVGPYIQKNHHHPASPLHSSNHHHQTYYNKGNTNQPKSVVSATSDKGLNRAVYIKTGNALHSDIEYYEYIIPKPISSSSILYRPPSRTSQSIRMNK